LYSLIGHSVAALGIVVDRIRPRVGGLFHYPDLIHALTLAPVAPTVMSTFPATPRSGEPALSLAEGVVQALDAIATPLWLLDPGRRGCFLNRAGRDLLGEELATRVEQQGVRGFPAEVAQALMAAEQRAIASGDEQTHATVIADAWGERRSFMVATRPWWMANGESRLLVTLQDVTTLQQVEQTLQRQSERERL
jgi:PAS domain-containing protein